MAKDQSNTPDQPANESTPADQDALALNALARGVLAREFRARASTVRRLAEGVLALQDEVKTARKKAKKAAKPKQKKNKKLAKIPGQKKGK